MIPDKIYLPKEELEERKPWIETTYDPNWDECYIRKDALLEWAKENLQEACDEESIPFEYYENGIITGKISAFEQVIIKLNSM